MIKTATIDIKTKIVTDIKREQTPQEVEQSALAAAQIEAEAQSATVATDIQTKLLSTIDNLKADLGTSVDPAGSTTINAILNQTNANINSSAATYIKSIARFMRTSNKAEIRAIRLLLRELSEADTLDEQPE